MPASMLLEPISRQMTSFSMAQPPVLDDEQHKAVSRANDSLTIYGGGARARHLICARARQIALADMTRGRATWRLTHECTLHFYGPV